ncbi:MAG: thiamine-phosphate kinase [Methylophilaceae bacterium]|nr:thiamine-phosphate kinase [Methylophilaceae bacterium]
MSEFNIIRDYFTKATQHTILSVGDDAALISVTTGNELAISADMLVAGTHFFNDADAYKLGWKSLAVNISDMAAMGASPKWATLSIALPHADKHWLSEFSRGFFACATKFKVDLIGGDTTRGPLTISVQIMGEVPHGKAIKRSGAKVGDDIWVSNTLGDAALGLAHLQNKLHDSLQLDDGYIEYCLHALHIPRPRVSLGLQLRYIATSAIDISDGLLSDLGHILTASKVGASIYLNQLPVSAFISQHLDEKQMQQFVLAAGDDYELCFTAPTSANGVITSISDHLNLKLTTIGKITVQQELIVLDCNHQPVTTSKTGFDHFA